MHGRRLSTRKKLTPKKPTRKIAKKRTIRQVFDTRGVTLTNDQQAWARSLTVSLSGWRSRQKFYKDHLESHLQAEAEAKAAEAAYDAQRIAQLAAEEKEEAEMSAILQAEAEEEKAEAWTHKAREMHLAGRGERKEKHEYYGWDPEEEEYLRDLETERLMAELRAKHKANHEAAIMAGYIDSEDECSELTDSGDSDSDSSGDSYIVVKGARSTSSQRSAPIVERATIVDWRQKARFGVVRKKLAVTKGWSAVTWNQKSNIQERLLVLEDDGFDIQEQLDRKATSEQVTALILERAAAKQPPEPQAGQAVTQLEQFVLPQDKEENLPPARLDHVLPELVIESHEQVTSSRSQSPLLASYSHSSSQAPRKPSDATEIIEDNAQPFSFDEPYYPQASRRLKRKRGDDADSDIDSNMAESPPKYKKRKTKDVAEDELADQELQDVKRAAFRKVFRAARLLVGKPGSGSRVVFTAETLSGKSGESNPDASSLDYLYAHPSKQEASTSSYSISTCAMNHITAELRFLTNTTEEDKVMDIYDPDCDEEMDYTPVEPDERNAQKSGKMQRQSSRITITKDDRDGVVFHGNVIIVAELLRVIGEQALLYRTRWEWDGIQLKRTNDLQWYLSPETRNTFIDIGERLRHQSQTGSDDIVVKIV